jgi:hypothetical protein
MRTPAPSSSGHQASARRGVRGWLAAALPLLFGAGCAGPPSSGRYVLAEDPGSRYGFEFVQDRETGRWVHRECELRVAAERVLPAPLDDPEHGSLMHVDLLKPGSIEGAGIRTLDPDLRDGYRVWYVTQVLGEHDLAGQVDYGIQVKWPEPGEETRFELLEIIHPPALTAVPLDEWSGWIEASRFREGGFAGIEEVSGEAPGGEVVPPEHPFALRCKLFLVDTPGFVP